MKKHYFDFIVHPLTLIYIIIALLSGRFSFLFIHLFCALIHELCHVLFCYIYKVKVESMTMLPFGFYAKITALEKVPFYQQIIIYLAGPLSIIITIPLIMLLYHFHIFSLYGYRYGIEAAFLVFFFNLLPFEPLDGGRIMKVLFLRLFDYPKALLLSLIISILASIYAIRLCLLNHQWVILLFIIISDIQNMIKTWSNYPLNLLMRLSSSKPPKIKVSKKPKIYAFYDNYYICNGQLYNENDIIPLKIKAWQKIKMKIKKNK